MRRLLTPPWARPGLLARPTLLLLCTFYTRTHACKHARRTHARTHAHTHTHSHMHTCRTHAPTLPPTRPPPHTHPHTHRFVIAVRGTDARNMKSVCMDSGAVVTVCFVPLLNADARESAAASRNNENKHEAGGSGADGQDLGNHTVGTLVIDVLYGGEPLSNSPLRINVQPTAAARRGCVCPKP